MKTIKKLIKFIKDKFYKRHVKKIVSKTNVKSKLDKSNWVANVNAKKSKVNSITYNKNVVEINSNNFKTFKRDTISFDKLANKLISERPKIRIKRFQKQYIKNEL